MRTASASAPAARAGSTRPAGRASSTIWHGVLLDETLRRIAPQPGFVQRCAAQQQRVPGLEAQFGRDQPRFAMQRAVVEQSRGAAAGELVAARVGGVLSCDAVREGMPQHVAECMRGRVARRRAVEPQAAAIA